jgi:hypothetical protein
MAPELSDALCKYGIRNRERSDSKTRKSYCPGSELHGTAQMVRKLRRFLDVLQK